MTLRILIAAINVILIAMPAHAIDIAEIERPRHFLCKLDQSSSETSGRLVRGVLFPAA
jgi:hypothetical protein